MKSAAVDTPQGIWGGTSSGIKWSYQHIAGVCMHDSFIAFFCLGGWQQQANACGVLDGAVGVGDCASGGCCWGVVHVVLHISLPCVVCLPGAACLTSAAAHTLHKQLQYCWSRAISRRFMPPQQVVLLVVLLSPQQQLFAVLLLEPLLGAMDH
jgi:hypothetical protein